MKKEISISREAIFGKFIEIAEHIPIPIIVYDFRKNLSINREGKNAVAGIFGSEKEFMAQIKDRTGLYKSIVAENEIVDKYRQVRKTGEAMRNIFIPVYKDGMEHIFLMNISLLTDIPNGTPFGFLTTFENITEVFNFNRELHYSLLNLKAVIEAFARDRIAYLLAYGEEETVKHLIEVRTFSELIADSIMKDSTISNKEILEYSKITPIYIKMLGLAALLHDFGKVEPKIHRLITSPRALTEDEYALVKEHPRLGANLIGYENEMLRMCWLVALYHHERWDGKGYPDGLKEHNIPLSARIVAFADMYSALKNKRAYKDPISSLEDIIVILKDNETAFDPVVYRSGMRLLAEMEMQSERIEEEYRNFEITAEEAVKLITDVFNAIMHSQQARG